MLVGVGWWVGVACVLVAMCCQRCALCVRVYGCARYWVLFDRQSPLEHAPAAVSRPLRSKMTTLPCKIYGSTSARFRQSPLVHAPCHGFAPLETKSEDASMQNPWVQKRAPLPPEPSSARPCQGFAAPETKSDDRSTKKLRVRKRAPLPPEPSSCGPRD